MCSLYELQKKEENKTRLQLQSLLGPAKRGEKVAAKLTANERRKVIFGDRIMEMDIWKMNWKKKQEEIILEKGWKELEKINWKKDTTKKEIVFLQLYRKNVEEKIKISQRMNCKSYDNFARRAHYDIFWVKTNNKLKPIPKLKTH